MISTFVIGFLLFAFSVTLHEFSHGYVAHLCGDDTAKRAGRLTLNPLKHIDPFWTVILPILLVLLRSPFVFGMAKPVPVNFLALKRPRLDMILVAAAGPISNILFGTVLLMTYPIVSHPAIYYMIILNLLLGFFNLIPIPPLDGGRILAGILPTRMAYHFSKIEPYGFFIILILMALGFVDAFVKICFQIFNQLF